MDGSPWVSKADIMTENTTQQTFYAGLRRNLDELKGQGLYKQERILSSRQGSTVTCDDGRQLINLCANNYLGLSGDEALAQAAAKSVERYGYGLSSVRFICGTQTVHKQLERAIADFTAGQQNSSGPARLVTGGDRHYDDKFYTDGRLAAVRQA